MTADEQKHDRVVDDPLARLRSLLVIDALISVGGAVFAVVVYVTAFDDGYMLVLAGIALLAALLMTSAWWMLDTASVETSLLLFAIGNWQAALGVALIGTFAWPLMLLAAVLPAIVVVPYSDRRQTRRYVVGSLAVALAVTLLGNLQDFSGVSDNAPEWSTQLVVAFFAPFLSALIVLTAWQNSARLQDALATQVSLGRRVEESRRRVVVATDLERRRIERDLHDGAQQRLVAMSMRVRRGQDLADREAEDDLAGVLDHLQSDVRDLQLELRSLIRGIYPPVLAQHGIAPALRAVVAEGELPVVVQVTKVDRQSSEIEAAIYFSCIEALQNAGKHADGSDIELALAHDNGRVEFTVRDSGPGFALDAVAGGNGLTNIVDRMEAVGGGATIESTPGTGTTVRGWVPSTP